jgi:rubrerythrin
MGEVVTVARCVEFAIKTEEAGAQLYRRLAEKFASDAELSELFEGLSFDEAHHRLQFQALHERALSRSGGGALTDEQEKYVRAMCMADVFANTRSLETAVEGIRTREDALERAFGLEKATLAYYQAMVDVVAHDEILEALVAAEKSHVVKVMELMITGEKFRGLSDRF